MDKKQQDLNILNGVKTIKNVITLLNDTNKCGIAKYYYLVLNVDESTYREVIKDNVEVYSVLLIPNVMYSYIKSIDIISKQCTDDVIEEQFGEEAQYIKEINKQGLNTREKCEDKCKELIKALIMSGGNIDIHREVTLEELRGIALKAVAIDVEAYTDNEEFEFDSIETDEEFDDNEEFDDEEPFVVDDNTANGIETLKELKEAWGEKLEYIIDGIMASYRTLYMSGYGLVSPAGILTNVGIIRSTTDGKITQNGNKAVDMTVFNLVNEALNNKFSTYAQRGAEPDIKELFKLKREGKNIIYTDMHLKFMYGHLRFCNGDNNISKYLAENNINNDSTTKVLKYSDIIGWIRETLENYFYKAYIDCGITGNATQDEIEKVNSINEVMSANLKNIIAVSERKSGVNTRIRICTDNSIDVDRLINYMRQGLNTGTSKNIDVRQIGSYENGVVDLNIIYNDKKYSQETLFAYQVLDTLEEQGIKLSWDNVILGKGDDGTIMTYNFRDKTNPIYAIYASSRSGKGVMTLNLIGAALADGCKILYGDGKPDMGNVLTDVAWKDGLDCAVYNGVSGKGSETLENRGNCIRREASINGLEELPDGIFITESEKQRFALITTYFKCIELICETAANRASQKLDTKDWVVAFMDECEQASVAEIEVMNCLERAETNRKAAKDENGKKIDLTKDPAYVFIQRYKSWLSIIRSNFKTCVTSTFGFANMTTFFIWQSTKFPEQYKNKSSLASVVDSASGNIVKIIGRGAAVNYGSSVFGTPSSLKDAHWYDERFSGKRGGYFAIGKNVQSDSMTVFRPFNVYSDANNKELILENAKASGLTADDLVGVSLNRDGSVIKEIGFEGYVDRLLAKYGLTVAKQLNIGFNYFDELVKSIGLGKSLNEYMYNTCNFGNKEDSRNKSMDTPDFDEYNNENMQENSIDSFETGGSTEEKYTSIKSEDREYISARNDSSELDNFNKAYSDIKETMWENGGNLGQVEIDATYGDISINVDENGNVSVNNKKGLDIIDLNEENFVDIDEKAVEQKSKFFDRMSKNRQSFNYAIRARWEVVLDEISRAFKSDSLVTRISIMSNGIVVNGRIVNINKLLDDGNGIELEDIVGFDAMLKRFRFVRQLNLDSDTFRWLVAEYGTDYKNTMVVFAKNKALNKIVINSLYGEQPIVIDRNSLGKSANEVQRMSNEAELRHQVEQMAASYNPKVEKKGTAYINRIVDTSYGFTKNNWKRAKRNLFESSNRHIVSGAFWIGASAVTGIIGTAFLAGKKMFNIFKK